MTTREHWEAAWLSRKAEQQSWFQAKPEQSLAMIHRAGVEPDSAIIDVGGGASRLVDYLLKDGHQDLTVLDISANAIKESQLRLGPLALSVQWLRTNILTFAPSREYDLWHDRAVFHFLTRAEDQQRYVNALRSGLRSGGQLVIAAFAPDGPQKCSGLDVRRHDVTSLERALGDSFQLIEQEAEDHLTPASQLQRFGYFRFIRI